MMILSLTVHNQYREVRKQGLRKWISHQVNEEKNTSLIYKIKTFI